MALADFGAGLNAALQQQMLLRLQQQRYNQERADAQQHRGDLLAQQAFENARQTKADQTAADSLTFARQRQGALDDSVMNERLGKQADTSREAFTPGQRMDAGPLTDQWQKFGLPVGTPQDATQPMGPAFTGPMDNGESPQQAQTGSPRGFLLTPTQKQQTQIDTTRDKNADNARQDSRDAEIAKRDAAMTTYQTGMLGVARQNANTNANKPPSGGSDARGDRSYQYHMSAVDKLGNPVADRMTRLSRLQDSLAQGTAVADAVTAPELMTAIAGGQGSGVRITQPELNAVIGARGSVAALTQAIQHMQNGESLTPEQRQQMSALVKIVADKESQKLSAVDDARTALMGSNDPMEHRRIYTTLQHTLGAIGSGGAGPAASTGGGTVPMTAPDGRALMVPADKVAEMESHGAKRR